MHQGTLTFIGLLAEAILIVSQWPQIHKSFKTKKTKDLSLITILSVMSGLVLWIIYGLAKPDNIIVIGNIASLAAFSVILYAKLRFS